MAIDWLEVHTKAAAMKNASVRILEITAAIMEPKIAGREISSETLNGLKTIDSVAARTAARAAWDELNAAMTT